MVMQYTFTMTIGTAMTVIREPVISPVSCMILAIEAINTQIDGLTSLRILEETSRLMLCNPTARFTFSSGPHKDVNNLIRFHIVVGHISPYR